MTTITAHHAHAKLRAVSLAIAAPLLALALSWASVDACAYTQHSLMGLYQVASTPA